MRVVGAAGQKMPLYGMRPLASLLTHYAPTLGVVPFSPLLPPDCTLLLELLYSKVEEAEKTVQPLK